MAITFTNYALNALLTDATQASSGAVAGILRGAVVHLFISNNTPTANDVPTSYMECTMPGYTSESVVWGEPYQNANGVTELDGEAITFTCDGTPVTQTIYGAFVTNAGGSELIYVDTFTPAQQITASGQGVTYLPSLVPSFASGIPQS